MEHKYNKGSEWRKWDLHVHTKGTNKNDQFTSISFDDFYKTFFKKAIKKEIYAIGITDYFSIDRYKDVVRFLETTDLSDCFSSEEIEYIKNIFILPNLELRMLPVTDSGRLVNIHCIFNPDYIDKLEHDFFSKIEHPGASKNYNMTKQGIIGLGKELDSSITKDEAAYEKGVNSFVVEHGKLKKIFEENTELRNNTIVVVSNSNKDGASAFQKHYDLFENGCSSLDGVRKSIYFLSDCIFSGNNNDRDYFSGTKKNKKGEIVDDEVEVVKKCRSLKPCIHGSDAHCEDKLFSPDEDKFCWIKADPTFDGLKQILCEPLGRVKIQPNNPDNKKSYNIIDKVRFINNSEEKFSEDEIGFSNGLNAIIGGKSSGKSLLLHMMASEIGNTTDVKDYKDTIGNSAIEVFYKDNPTQKRNISDNRIIEFLPQLYIEKLVRNEEFKNTTARSFNEFVEKLIKQDESINTIISSYKDVITEASSNIDSSITEWSNLDADLLVAKEERTKLGDKSAVGNEINVIKANLETLTKSAGWTEEQKLLYNKLIEENKEKESRKAILIKTNEELSRLKTYIENKVVSDIDNSIQFTTNNNVVSELVTNFKTLINASFLELKLSFISNINIDSSKNQTLIDSLNAEIATNNSTLKPLMDKNAIQTEITKFEVSLKEEQIKIENIVAKDTQIENLRNKISGIDFIAHYKSISDSYYELTLKLNEAISQKWSKESTKLDIKAKTKFNSIVFIESLSGVISRKGYLNNQFDNYIFDTNDYFYDKNNHLDKMRKLIEYAIRENDRFVIFKQGKITKEFLASILKDCFSIEYDIVKGSDSLQSMSEGKKGIVILQLYLSLSQSLIDQPEDNLDNRTVYKELNDYIKQCKQRRQIIMVSHNANLVVNTDAENVIIANQSGEDCKDNKQFRFEYVNGSLENTFVNDAANGILYKQGIREHVCEILEGGVDAFKKREEKYHFKN